MNNTQFEDEVLPKVLANEATCRIFVKSLLATCGGITRTRKYSDEAPVAVEIDDLSHDELISIASRVWIEIKKREAAHSHKGSCL